MISRVQVQRADVVPDRARSPDGPKVSAAPACEYIAQPKRSSKCSTISAAPFARSAVRSSKKIAPSPWTSTRRSWKRRPARASGGVSPGGRSVRSSVHTPVSSPLKITSWYSPAPSRTVPRSRAMRGGCSVYAYRASATVSSGSAMPLSSGTPRSRWPSNCSTGSAAKSSRNESIEAAVAPSWIASSGTEPPRGTPIDPRCTTSACSTPSVARNWSNPSWPEGRSKFAIAARMSTPYS